jgi:hypothetical protein
LAKILASGDVVSLFLLRKWPNTTKIEPSRIVGPIRRYALPFVDDSGAVLFILAARLFGRFCSCPLRMSSQVDAIDLIHLLTASFPVALHDLRGGKPIVISCKPVRQVTVRFRSARLIQSVVKISI